MNITPYARVGRSPLIKAVGLQKNFKEIYYTKTLEQGSKLSTGERQLISFARVVLVQITKMWNLPNLCLRRFRQRRNNAVPAARLRSIKQFTRNM